MGGGLGGGTARRTTEVWLMLALSGPVVVGGYCLVGCWVAGLFWKPEELARHFLKLYCCSHALM